MQAKLRLGVLGSGSGSNFQAILDAINQGSLDAEVVLVLSDFSDAKILQRAEQAGIAAGCIDCRGFKSKFPLESQQAVAQQLKQAGVDLVCLAGFMRLIGKPLLEAFPARILNIHPSLLPNYPGLHAWEQAVEDGASESGATVHLVDEGMDTGPILTQGKVAVLEGDTPASLHARIQQVEHALYPQVIRDYAAKLASLPQP